MRTSSSLPVVGELLPPWNVHPLVGAGKIPAVNRDLAFASMAHSGIVLFGKGVPGVSVPGAQFAPNPGTFGTTTWSALPSAIVAGNTAPVPAPLASGYMLANGTVGLRLPPLI